MSKLAYRIRCHGNHGSKPLFEGDCWTMYMICGACGGHIDPYDKTCKHCNAEFIGEKDE